MADLSLGGVGSQTGSGGISERSNIWQVIQTETVTVLGGDLVDPGLMKEKEKESGLELELELGLGLGLGSGLQFDGGNKAAGSLDPVWTGSEKNEKIGFQKIATESNSAVAFDQNGISLVVEVHGSLESQNQNGKEFVNKDNNGLLAYPGIDSIDKSAEKPSSMSKLGDSEVNGNEKEDDDGNVGEDNDKDTAAKEHYEYSVGDFVWSKIKTHPWWPGKIYDPSAAKYRQMDRHLVAYFGDRSFSWCLSSQLKPFTENFEEMSKQCKSRSFVNAVQEALDEFGRCAELGLTCSCVPEWNRIGLTSPVAMNTGIREGTLVAVVGINKLSIRQCQPSELLAHLKWLAQAHSLDSILELTLLKSWLSAFYRVKRDYSLPIYQESQGIEALEDNDRNEQFKTYNFNVPVEVPIQGPSDEDRLYLLGSSEKSPREEKLKQRWKRRSVAELLKEDVNKGKTAKKATRTDASEKKRKGNGNHGDNMLTFPWAQEQQKKKSDRSGYTKRTKKKISSVDKSGNRGEAVASKTPLSKKRKGTEVLGIEIDESKEGEYVSSPRERKKSKYLSPPYTSLSTKKLSYMGDLESEKIAKIARMEERVTKAAGQLLESDDKNIIDSVDIGASISEVLSEVQSAATDPSHSSGRLDVFWGFLSTFRSSVYTNGSYYKWYHKHLPDMHHTNNEPAKSISGGTPVQRNQSKYGCS